MAEHLILRMNVDAGEVTAVALDEEGRLLAHPERMPLDAAAARAHDRQVTVLLPPHEVVSCVVKMPAAAPARLRQMLPFTLEDDFAGDIDELHFAAGARNDQDLLAVSVIARDRLDSCLSLLEAAGIEPKRICSEADAVPDTPETTTLFLEEDKLLGRRPGCAPFAFSELGLGDLWRLLEDEREEADDLKHVVLCIDSETRQAKEAEIGTWRGALDNLSIKELADGALPHLASNLVHSPGPNLLQGAYAPRSNIGALAKPWRTAAGFLLAFAALLVLGKGATLWKHGADVDALNENIAAVCAQSYATADVNACRLEMLRRLDSAGQPATGGGLGYLATQAVVAAAAGQVLEMEQISYTTDGVLRLEFIAPDVPWVDAFSQAVIQGGQFQVRDQRTDAEPGGVKTRLSIVARGR